MFIRTLDQSLISHEQSICKAVQVAPQFPRRKKIYPLRLEEKNEKLPAIFFGHVQAIRNSAPRPKSRNCRSAPITSLIRLLLPQECGQNEKKSRARYGARLSFGIKPILGTREGESLGM
jgi:hypothetical protein